MNKKNNLNINTNDIISNLNAIKIILCLILIVLVVNVVLVSINMNKNVSSTNDNTVEHGEEIPEYDVSEFNELSYSEYKKTIKSKGTHVIYIGRETCGYCAMFIPTMVEAQEKYGFKTNYLDISKIFNFETNSVIDQTAYDEMSKFNDFFEENFLATPMVVIFKDGKYVDGTLGYQDIDTYSSFLEKNNFVKK